MQQTFGSKTQKYLGEYLVRWCLLAVALSHPVMAGGGWLPAVVFADQR